VRKAQRLIVGAARERLRYRPHDDFDWHPKDPRLGQRAAECFITHGMLLAAQLLEEDSDGV
jgi:hypothetical protein